jgi:hypothetical protein
MMKCQANSRVLREKMERLKARQGARRLIIGTPWRFQWPVAIFSSYPTKGIGQDYRQGEGKLPYLLVANNRPGNEFRRRRIEFP